MVLITPDNNTLECKNKNKKINITVINKYNKIAYFKKERSNLFN